MNSELQRLETLLQKRRKVLTICVEGNIGSGKTTLIESIERRHLDNVREKDGSQANTLRVFSEPLTTWTNYHGINMLEGLYADPKANTLQFQILVYLTMRQRYSQLLKYVDQFDFEVLSSSVGKRYPPMYVYERCALSAHKVFIAYHAERGNFSGAGQRIMEDVYNVDEDVLGGFVPSIVFNDIPDILVYLKTSPQNAFERLQSRCRGNEKTTITLDNISTFNALYDAYINELSEKRGTLRNMVVIELDGNKTPEEVLNEYVKEVESQSTFYML